MTELRVVISEEVAQRLGAEAAERGTSPEDFAAELLTFHVPVTAAPARRPRFVGKGHSGRHDLSERVEEILRVDLGS